MRQIKAAVCRAFGQPMEIETIGMPAPAAGEVCVEIEACAVCHSDVTFWKGGWGGALPAVYGHEAVGRVSSVGSGVSVPVGARVLVTLIRACGGCASCAGGRPTQCAAPGGHPGLGNGVAAAMDCGAFAEAVVVDASQVVPVPEAIPAQAACILSCGVVTGLGAVVNTARVRPGDWVVVIGAGGVGLNTVQAARLSGAARVVAVDLSEEKLAVAREFGATDGVLADVGPDGMAALGRLADHAFVTVGAPQVIDGATAWLAPHGTAYLVGMPHVGTVGHYDPVTAAYYGQGLRGTRMGDVVLQRDIPWILDLHAQGRLKLEELVSGVFSLEDINAAFAATAAGSGRRNVIVMG